MKQGHSYIREINRGRSLYVLGNKVIGGAVTRRKNGLHFATFG